MRLWRISDFADLSGSGGLAAAGRWHSRGRRVVYLADHPASALLEILVRREVDTEDLPDKYHLLVVETSTDLAFDTVDQQTLSAGWRTDEDATRTLGDRWLAENHTALLQVPSAIVPLAWNWLLNPAHPLARMCTIVEVIVAEFDKRLFR
jgi:RES domain-containing protein